MSKVLHCRNIVPGCDYVARGETREEVFTRESEHVRLKHQLREVPPDILEMICGVIFDEDRYSPEYNRRDGEAGPAWWPAARRWEC